MVVDYLGQQYIIELKTWRGERYNADGERQIRNGDRRETCAGRGQGIV